MLIQLCTTIRKTLLDELTGILKLSETALIDLLLYGELRFDLIQDNKILIASIKFIMDYDRFIGFYFLVQEITFVFAFVAFLNGSF